MNAINTLLSEVAQFKSPAKNLGDVSTESFEHETDQVKKIARDFQELSSDTLRSLAAPLDRLYKSGGFNNLKIELLSLKKALGDGAEIKSNSLLITILNELKNIRKENLLKLLQDAKTKIETLIESVNSLSTPVIDKFSELYKAITEPQRQTEEVVKSE